VAGPGDETYLYLPDSISSIKGYWAGTSRVTARVVPGPQAGQSIASSTRQADWGNAIQAKHSEQSTPQRLWVRVKLPSAAEYAGKTLLCKIDLAVRYPVVHNDENFAMAVKNFQHEATLELAAPLAARTYRTWWWCGFAGGLFLLTVSILARLRGAEALRRTAGPTEILEEQAAE
jgi:hypothetical protein